MSYAETTSEDPEGGLLQGVVVYDAESMIMRVDSPPAVSYRGGGGRLSKCVEKDCVLANLLSAFSASIGFAVL